GSARVADSITVPRKLPRGSADSAPDGAVCRGAESARLVGRGFDYERAASGDLAGRERLRSLAVFAADDGEIVGTDTERLFCFRRDLHANRDVACAEIGSERLMDFAGIDDHLAD